WAQERARPFVLWLQILWILPILLCTDKPTVNHQAIRAAGKSWCPTCEEQMENSLAIWGEQDVPAYRGMGIWAGRSGHGSGHRRLSRRLVSCRPAPAPRARWGADPPNPRGSAR